MSGIFISYRREDSIAHAGRLFDRLRSHFRGTHHVFMDIDSIQPGEDFIEKIEQTVSSCDVLISVIGTEWLSASSEDRQLRLRDPQDFVHLEIRAALERKIRVIPALVGGARMPAAHHLPAPLVELARRQAIEINDRSFDQSISRLIEVLEECLTEAEQRRNAAQALHNSAHHQAPPRSPNMSRPLTSAPLERVERRRQAEMSISRASVTVASSFWSHRALPIAIILLTLGVSVIAIAMIEFEQRRDTLADRIVSGFPLYKSIYECDNGVAKVNEAAISASGSPCEWHTAEKAVAVAVDVPASGVNAKEHDPECGTNDAAILKAAAGAVAEYYTNGSSRATFNDVWGFVNSTLLSRGGRISDQWRAVTGNSGNGTYCTVIVVPLEIPASRIRAVEFVAHQDDEARYPNNVCFTSKISQTAVGRVLETAVGSCPINYANFKYAHIYSNNDKTAVLALFKNWSHNRQRTPSIWIWYR